MTETILRAFQSWLAIAALSVVLYASPASVARGQASQTPSAATPTSTLAFEVVSIKPVEPGGHILPVEFPGSLTYRAGRFGAHDITLAGLVMQAFRSPERNIDSSRVLGGPDWITTTRFEIVATLGSDAGLIEFSVQAPALIRALLEERFKLKTHFETRTFPVFNLVKARADGRLGPQLHSKAVDCDAALRDELARTAADPKAPRVPPLCSLATSPGKISATGMTMKTLAASLRNSSGRTVVDRTGLPGTFDFDVQWSPNSLGTDGLTVFTALQEQLGLKLESGEAPMDVVVIEHVEMPTPN